MQTNITKRVLDNFISGQYSYNEYLQVKEWFNNVHDHEEVKNYLLEYWKEINNEREVGEKSLEHIYENIKYNLLLEEQNESKRRRFWEIYRQIAAILLIPLVAFSIYFYITQKLSPGIKSGWIEINAPKGARTEFMLPDGSRGWLSSGSKLRYVPPFIKSRIVELSGQAFFDVTSQKSVFTVSIEHLNVSVYGTKFNVTAYSGENLAEVVLESGSVKIIGKTCSLDKTLLPNQKLTYRPNDNKYSIQHVNAEIYTSWKDGFLMMDNEKFEQTAKRIEKWYNVEIIIEDEVLKNYRFKATFKDEPVEEVLRLMALTTPIEYKIQRRETEEVGVYKKKEIFIRLKR